MRIKLILNSVLIMALIMFGTSLLPNAGGFSYITNAQAAVVSSIDVRGNQRIDDDVVASYLTISPGESFNDFDIDDSVKALFRTGLFSDVSIFQEGGRLVVDVDENATVNKVFIEGNKRVKDEQLLNFLRHRPQETYSDQTAANDVEIIKIAYARVGRRDAAISFEVIPLENNRVNVIYRVNEGAKTKIASISFIGNDTFSDRRLADVIATKESTFLSFLSTSDIYDPNRLNSDEEALRTYYFNRGFADFQVLSTNADLDEVANEYSITITIEEGARYSFGNVTIDNSIQGVDESALPGLIETAPGDYYSASKVEESILSLTNDIAGQGFAFVEVAPRGNRNFDDNTIDVTYVVDEGARVFIEDIRILGNDRTRDYVLRREFDVSEGDAYNQVLIQQTQRRLQALGFFENVAITTRPGSSPDRIVVIVTVIEQSTGDVSIAGGASSNDGISANVSFTERNFLGRGQFLSVGANTSENGTGYNFNFTEPYFLGTRISAGIGIEVTESDERDEQRFTIDSQNVTLTFGLPLTPKLNSSVFYSYKNSDVGINSILLDPAGGPAGSSTNGNGFQGDIATELSSAFSSTEGEFISSGIGYTLTYTDVDNFRSPREGIRAQITQTFYGLGGDAEYFNTEGTVSLFATLSEESDVIWVNRVRGGHAELLGDDDGTNFRSIDNFFSRQNYVRGFDSSGFGPRDPITGDALGGQTFWAATTEVQFPLPFVPKSLGLRGAVFADAGQLLNVGDFTKSQIITNTANIGLTADQLNQLNDDGVRASVGASVLWDSPFGPLRVDYAVPLNDEPFDDIEEFNFGVSSNF